MKVLLLCNGGMSTGIMKMKIEQAAKADGQDVEVSAKSLSVLDEYKDEYDVFLLGPQVRFAQTEVKESVGKKPVMVIQAQDFGMMRGDKVWEQLKEVMK